MNTPREPLPPQPQPLPRSSRALPRDNRDNRPKEFSEQQKKFYFRKYALQDIEKPQKTPSPFPPAMPEEKPTPRKNKMPTPLGLCLFSGDTAEFVNFLSTLTVPQRESYFKFNDLHTWREHAQERATKDFYYGANAMERYTQSAIKVMLCEMTRPKSEPNTKLYAGENKMIFDNSIESLITQPKHPKAEYIGRRQKILSNAIYDTGKSVCTLRGYLYALDVIATLPGVPVEYGEMDRKNFKETLYWVLKRIDAINEHTRAIKQYIAALEAMAKSPEEKAKFASHRQAAEENFPNIDYAKFEAAPANLKAAKRLMSDFSGFQRRNWQKLERLLFSFAY